MPETGFVLAEPDELLLAKAILDMGAVLVPDLDYPTDEHARIGDIHSFVAHRSLTRLFFVLHPSFQEASLEMREILKDGKQVWYVEQRNGGPAINLLLCVVFSEDQQERISEGSVHHNPIYWCLASNRPAPISLKQFYAGIVKILKSEAQRQKIGKRNYWVGQATSIALASGQLRLGFGPELAATQL